VSDSPSSAPDQPTGVPPSQDYWRDYLEKGETFMRWGRHVFSALPGDPRCRLCTVPFQGAGGRTMRLFGYRPSDANPNVCNTCQKALIKHHGGAEVAGTMLFADIRGSTTIAEGMGPSEYRELMERFYRVATRAVIGEDGAIDKFVGDELVAMFYRALAGEGHPARAVKAARAILRETGHGTPDGPWLPVGAGVHTGRVWFGAVGEAPHVELTSLGDVVNTTARLASAAGGGEVLVSRDAAAAAGLGADLERRSLKLKGKELPFEVVVVGSETVVA
jgi:adenylate cyclase